VDLAFIKLIAKYGLMGAITVYLIYNMVTKVDTTGQTTLDLLRAHTMDTSHYLYQNCVNTAMLAGTAKELCSPPPHER